MAGGLPDEGRFHRTMRPIMECSLLCGYASEHVGRGAGFEAICHQHSHVVGEGRT
jgi:hypothetical protein